MTEPLDWIEVVKERPLLETLLGEVPVSKNRNIKVSYGTQTISHNLGLHNDLKLLETVNNSIYTENLFLINLRLYKFLRLLITHEQDTVRYTILKDVYDRVQCLRVKKTNTQPYTLK